MRNHTRKGGRSEQGFTLIEIVIATIVLAAMVAGIYAVLFRGMDMYEQGATTSELERKGQRVLEQVSEEIVLSGLDVLTPQASPPYATSTLTLQRNLGWSGGAVSWGPPTVFEFQPDPGDKQDGKDNNGNGLIDEGMVVRWEMTATGPSAPVVMTRWVPRLLEGETDNGMDDNGNGLIDEPGLCFDRVGDIWTIRLSLERIDASGRKATRTLETAVRPRN
jgi:prepilin-type N-terminal cleavage/methylation domain-containing protein